MRKEFENACGCNLLLSNTIPSAHRERLNDISLVLLKPEVTKPTLGNEILWLGEVARIGERSQMANRDDGLSDVSTWFWMSRVISRRTYVSRDKLPTNCYSWEGRFVLATLLAWGDRFVKTR